jgi:large subunit ribosomal protein L19
MAKKRIERKVPGRGTQKNVAGLAAKVASVEAQSLRSDLPEYHIGDTVRVHARIKEGEKERIQVYEGVVIARSGKGASRSMVVRKISHGVGVERIFLETSKRLAKLEVVSSGKVRRSKLYFLRDLQGRAAKLEREMDTVGGEAPAKAAATTKTPSKN